MLYAVCFQQVFRYVLIFYSGLSRCASEERVQKSLLRVRLKHKKAFKMILCC